MESTVVLLVASVVIGVLLFVIFLQWLWLGFFQSNESEARVRSKTSRRKKTQLKLTNGNPPKPNDSKSLNVKSKVNPQSGSAKQRNKSSKNVSESLSKSPDVQYSSLQDEATKEETLSVRSQMTSSITRPDWSLPLPNIDEPSNKVETNKELAVSATTVVAAVTADSSSHLNRNELKQDEPSSSGLASAPIREETNHYKNVDKTQQDVSRDLKHRKSSNVQQTPLITDSCPGNNISGTFRGQNQSECEEEGVLFIDNSNIFIEGNKFYAKHQKLRVKTDPCFRIDIGKLCQALLNGKRMSYGKLYGSEPPDLDTLWTKIREGGLEVDKFERNYKGKEKEVDNALSSDATAYACEMIKKQSRETIIFLAGDRDYCPAVENILRRGWRVEVAAFSFSMSSKMKQIARSNKSLKIVELDELLISYQPCPYYVNRQWRPLRANYTHRRIPRENTKVFSFKKEFDVDNMSDVMNVRKLADTIAGLVRIPCNFYCHRINERKSRTVFIIFLLSRYGMHDDQDPGGPRKVVGCNLDQAWNDCRGLIDKKCKNIFDEYQLDRYEDAVSFIQSMHTIKNTEQMEMSNAFSRLSIESLPWCSEMDSDDTDNEDDMIDDDEEDFDMCDLNQGIDSHDAAAEDPSAILDEFKVVKQKSKRNHATSSFQCEYSFNCKHAKRCYKKHSKLEQGYFKHCQQHGFLKKSYYKSTPCTLYIKRNCNTGNTEISPCCPFYHSVKESRCYYCTPFSGSVGHQATQECADKVDKPYFLSGKSCYKH